MNDMLEDLRWQAVVARDARSDGKFVFAVSSTGVYCRPSCPSKRPRRENVTFFGRPQDAETAGFRPCLRCRPRAAAAHPRLERIKSVCRYLEEHLDEPVTLEKLAARFNQSPFHLQRTFKAELGITPKAYADACRMREFREKLKQGQSVTRAMHEAGYSSTSRLYSRTAAELGMHPGKYRSGAIAMPIRYTLIDSPLGKVLLATTDKGICSVRLGDSAEELEQGLQQEFPFARRRRDDAGLAELAEKLMAQARGVERSASLPLDIQATAFERRVWSCLRSIRCGETRTYAEVAKAIRQPSAVRAVARACARNPVAIVVPCHRVIRSDGQLGGYRWGVERKQSLLEMEATAARES